METIHTNPLDQSLLLRLQRLLWLQIVRKELIRADRFTPSNIHRGLLRRYKYIQQGSWFEPCYMYLYRFNRLRWMFEGVKRCTHINSLPRY